MIFLCLCLLAVITYLAVRLYQVRKSVSEIAQQVRFNLENDTRTRIGISSKDPELEKMAENLNAELEVLYAQKLENKKASQEMKKTVANMAHDLRTPLTTLMGYTELLENQPEKQEEYLKVMQERLGTMKRLTDQLFSYSLFLEKQEINKKTFCLNRTCEEVLLSYAPSFEQNGIAFNLKICEKRIIIESDEELIKRILSNLLENALKYAKEKVVFELNEKGVVEVSNPAQNWAALDTSRLFGRYYSIPLSKPSGGLGLSIARELSNKVGCQLKAEVINKNLAFVLTCSDLLV